MGANGSKITAQDKAILDLKTQRDKLHQYQRRITVLAEREVEVAKRLLAKGDRKRALLALRQKKDRESLLAKTDAQLAQLEQLTTKVEFALIEKDVLFGIQQGTKVLQDIHREMGGVQNVERLMNENADAIAYEQEISELLGSRMSNQDEEEVEEEFTAMVAEAKGKAQQLPTVPDISLPSIQENVADSLPSNAKQEERTAVLAE